MAHDKQPPSPLVDAVTAFDESLRRYRTLAGAAQRGDLDSQNSLERAGETLSQIAACEEDLHARAQTLMGALAAARDAQQAEAEAVRARALEIQTRTDDYRRVLGTFEAIGTDASALNATAQGLAARGRTPEDMVKDGELVAGLDELQERMAAVADHAAALTADARGARFEDLARKADGLRQQILAARNKIGLLKDSLARAAPAKA